MRKGAPARLLHVRELKTNSVERKSNIIRNGRIIVVNVVIISKKMQTEGRIVKNKGRIIGRCKLEILNMIQQKYCSSSFIKI